jgi:hypothetical protein
MTKANQIFRNNSLGFSDESARCRPSYFAARRVELAKQPRQNRRPPEKRVKEKDVTATLTQLRDLLKSDVGLTAPVLKELVGHVVSEAGIVAGYAKPQMFARFTINALPALAAIGRAQHPDGDEAPP